MIEPELPQSAAACEIENVRDEFGGDDDRVPTLAVDTPASRPGRAVSADSSNQYFERFAPHFRMIGRVEQHVGGRVQSARATASPAFTDAIISASGSTRTELKRPLAQRRQHRVRFVAHDDDHRVAHAAAIASNAAATSGFAIRRSAATARAASAGPSAANAPPPTRRQSLDLSIVQPMRITTG